MAKVIRHYGTKRHSGRYPWGSGGDSNQRGGNFLSFVDDLKAKGLSETEIATGMGMNTRQLRERRSIARAEQRAADAAMVYRLKEKGYSNVAIGKRMKLNESTIRSLLDPSLKDRAASTAATSMVLKDAVDNKRFIDIGIGIEEHLGITRTKLNTAVAMLREEGYVVHPLQVRQIGTGKYTTMKILTPPGTPWGEVQKNQNQISMVDDYSEDGGRSFLGLEPVRSINSNRIMIRYGDEGGSDKDGVIQLRKGVEDLDLGDATYAQVRVGVDGKYYMKGMAMHADNVPSGYDVVYNTSKLKGTPAKEIYKVMVDDPDNPFGTTLRQKHYIDANGNEQLSALNIVGSVPGAGEEGSWGRWSKSLSAQVLSKQTSALAKQQLGLALNLKQEEFDEIMSLTNPSVKKALLESYANDADAAAVHLKAAALPRQASQVLLPFNSIKDGEIYAPNFRNGEVVALVRYPHGGTFEIPQLIVNNRNAEAKGLIKSAKDAVGINPKVAKRLSGADFDGDAVVVIPNAKRLLKTSKALTGLKDFDPQSAYPAYEGMKTISPRTKQKEMGSITNLVTDMTIKGASPNEIARAVRHSMVVIDAEKHGLNYKQSAIDNGIGSLKEKYQGKSTAGAATLISKAGSAIRVLERKEGKFIKDPQTGKKRRVKWDPTTGKKLYEETGETYVDAKGKVVKRLSKTKRMAEVDDAFELSSGTSMEKVYASYANKLKAFANKARRVVLRTKDIPYSPSARKTFDPEVRTLRDKLALAFRNKPLERKAQIMATKVITAKKRANPGMDDATLKKVKFQALEEARARYKARKADIKITDREWLAIQAGATSPTFLKKVLDNTDTKKLKERAMPRVPKLMSPTRMTRARTMLATGYTRAEVADALGVSVSTVTQAMEGEE
jgi:DNA-binding CsgD family transcriptional regulator